MPSDEKGSDPDTLIKTYRPHTKVPSPPLRRTVEAILWRHQNGAKWRAIPTDLGPWWRAAQVFMRWARAGVGERLLGLVQECGLRLGMVFLDETNVRAHQKAAGAARRGDLKPSETTVKHSAGLVAGMAPRPA